MANAEHLISRTTHKFNPYLESGDVTSFLSSSRAKYKPKYLDGKPEKDTSRPTNNLLKHLDSSVLVQEFGDPYAAIAAAVILTAIKDLKSNSQDKHYSASLRGNLRSFFYSEGFEIMIDGLGWDKENFHRLFEAKFGS